MFPFATELGTRGVSASDNRGAQAKIDIKPRLRDAIERVVVKIVKSLQTMAGTTTTIEGMLSGLDVDTAKAVLAAHRPANAAAILECPDMRASMLLTLDATLVHAVVELLCGGNGSEPMHKAARAVTPIDLQFSQIVFSLAASALQTEWAEYGFAGTRSIKIENGLPPDLFGARGENVAIIKIAIGAFGLHGALRLALPKALLDRFVEPDDALETPSTSDPAWATLFNKQIEQASVTLDAYLEATDITLATLANLRVGQVLALPAEAREHVALINASCVLYRGELGQAEDLYSMRINEIVSDRINPVTIEPRRSPLHDLSKG